MTFPVCVTSFSPSPLLGRFYVSEPCPISRCALEWFLAVQMLITALFVWVVADHGVVGDTLGLSMVPSARAQWSLLVTVPALLQMAALAYGRQYLQRLAALFSLAACVLLTLILFTSPLTILAGLYIGYSGGQLYVVAMLRGAPWRSFRNSGTASPSSGS